MFKVFPLILARRASSCSTFAFKMAHTLGTKLGVYLLFFCALVAFTAEGHLPANLCPATIARNGEYVVIVDAFSSGTQIAAYFKRLGYKIIHVRGNLILTQATLNGFRSQDFHPQNRVELGNFEHTLEWLQNKQKRSGGRIAYVIAGTEVGVQWAEQLATELGIDTNDPRTLLARRSKYEMQMALQQAGIDIIPTHRAFSSASAIRFIREDLGGFKAIGSAIIKPEDSHGSDQLERAHTLQQVRDIFKANLHQPTTMGLINQSLLVQPFIKGQEYAINGAVYEDENGKLWLRITDAWRYNKHKSNGAAPMYGHEILIPWYDIPPGVKEFTGKMLKTLGFRRGAFHAEIFVTDDGKIYLVEVAARLYGAGNTHIGQVATKYGQIQAMVDSYENPERFKRVAFKPYLRYSNAYVFNVTTPPVENGDSFYMNSNIWKEIERELGKDKFKIIKFFNHGDKINSTTSLLDMVAQIELLAPVDGLGLNDLRLRRHIKMLSRHVAEGNFWTNVHPGAAAMIMISRTKPRP